MRRFFGFLFNRWLLIALGFLCFALVVWFVGPLIAIAEWKPLAPVWVRLTLILGVIGLYLLRQLYRLARTLYASRKIEAGMAGRDTKLGEPTAEHDELGQRFNEALAILKQARVQAAGGGFKGWLAKLDTSRHLYQLPWYVIVGAPGTGKTTALANSGLQFPLADKYGEEGVQGVGGTRNCHWLFSDRAVLLDTAGRYSTHDSNKAADGAEWAKFLGLLSRHRPRQPINGVLVAISATDLMQSTSVELDIQANALRARIQELRDELKIDFPLYVLITKLDLLAGFGEFFDDLTAEERAQVWGMTLPLPAAGEQVAFDSVSAEFDGLMDRLHARLLDRLERERDAGRRERLYAFPQRFAVLKAPLAEFTRRVFAQTPYQERSLLRGIYFTSGTQSGQPVDPLLGRVSDALAVERGDNQSRSAAVNRSHFISRLLTDVVFAEAGLAGLNRRWQRQRMLLAGGGYASLALLSVGALAAWTVSYFRNQDYIDTVAKQVPPVRTQVEKLGSPETGQLSDLVPVLKAAYNVASTPEVTREDSPLAMHFGLYIGDKLHASADNAYQRLLQDALLPRIALRLEDQLKSSEDPELQYEALKTYLMLHDSNHFDATDFKAWVMADWETALAREVTTEQRTELERHLDAMLARKPLISPLPMNQQLVAEAREKLQQRTLPERVYGRIKRLGVGEDLPAFKISEAAGPSAMLVFTRASGEPLTKGVPGFFSVRGYYQAFTKAVDKVAVTMAAEQVWVLNVKVGPDGKPLGETIDPIVFKRLNEDVRRLYLMEYANTWERFVNDIRLIQFGNLQQSVRAARLLSAADSPLSNLLRGIVRETSLTQIAEENKTITDRASEAVVGQKNNLLRLIGQNDPLAGKSQGTTGRIERIVDDRFEGLRRLVISPTPGGAAPLDASLSLMNEFYTYLTATETAVQSGSAPPQSDLPTRLKAEADRMPEPMRSMMQSLSTAGVSQALVETRKNLSSHLGSAVGDFCSKAINSRYPFNRNASSDVRPEDFAKVFATGGVLDDFFQRNLASFVDVTKKPWTFRKVGEGSMGDSSGALIQFQRAATIRDVFFQGGARTPSLRLDFKPVEMDASLIQSTLDIDGQLVRYSHGPQTSTTVTWPGPKGGHQVRLSLTGTGGAEVGGLSFEGAWALFRAIDRAQVTPGSQPERFRVSFDINGKKIQYEVTAGSVLNPFRLADLAQFQCPAQL
ncbi:type VI secretion system membrane subunit TssM [Chitinimonas lacunae]|uniref:Type VI secretion system membrane subunit TssM n=1 Tax=Chitinimonas lacunae TaxID=1963018 RepID=A0ABV8MXJ2_9NEIS